MAGEEKYKEIQLVEELGEKIGYGNMMEIASALWARKLKNWYGAGLSDGAFVPTILDFVKDEHIDTVKSQLDIYRGRVDLYFKEYKNNDKI